MNLSLEGVSLQVADVERSVGFYAKFPGAQLIMHRPGQFAKFKTGDGRCPHRTGRSANRACVRQSELPRPRPGRQHPGIRHGLKSARG